MTLLQLWAVLISTTLALSPSVTLPQGTLIGIQKSYPPQSLEAFLGIPYAKASRFEPPVKIPASSAIVNATAFGPICPQNATTTNTTQSEDCLFINVWRPANTTSYQDLPVVTYIHGGSFVKGSSSESRDIGNMIAWASVPIIGVAMNYRLGAIGFPTSSSSARLGKLNLGLKDQLLALQWIQENIAAFGGDPERVTLMGDSAGGHSIGHHVQSPLSAGLFSQAIMESGAATARFCQPYNSAIQEIQFNNLTTALNITTADISDDEIFTQLQAVSIETLRETWLNIFDYYDASLRWPFQPAIDGPGGLIPEAPLDIWGSGSWNKVPILTGFCSNEGTSFAPNINTSTEFTDFFRTMNPNLTNSEIDTIDKLYPDPLTTNSTKYLETQGLGPEFNRLGAAYGEFAYISPVRMTAHYAASFASAPPVYLYEAAFNISAELGTGHDCAISYIVYASSVVNISQTQQQLSAAISESWTSFIAYGDPNKVVGKAPGRVEWPQYNPGAKQPNIMIFGEGNDERAGGSNLGIVTQASLDSKFQVTGNFWWSRTANTENS